METLLKNIILLLLLFSPVILCAQNIEYCDQLIVEGVKEMNNKNHSKSLETLIHAKTLALDNNWHKQVFLSYNNIGANYYMMLDYGEALDNYLEAYKLAIKNLDDNFEMIVLNNIAILYSKEKQVTKAEEFFRRALDIALKKNDSLKIGIYAVNLAILANEKNELKKSDEYITISFDHLEDSSLIINQVYLAKAQNHILKKEFQQAKSIVDRILPAMNTPEMSENRLMAYMLLSSVFEDQNNIENAIYYAEQTRFDPESSIENQIEAYNRLAELYLKIDENNRAFQYKDSVILAKDSLNQIKNGKLFENSRIKFELQNYQKELFKSQQKLEAERKMFYLILFVAIVTIFIVVWAMRINNIKQKQKKIIAENNQKIIKLELENEKNDKMLLEQKLKEKEALNLLEQEKLKTEIESKNRQLATKALLLSSHNELIEEIIQVLLAENEISANQEMKKTITKLKHQLKKDSDWTDFLTHFEEVNQNFLKTLKDKHPTLNQNDIRFLSYIYMNLSTKEISTLFNITLEACRKRKERIIKKMDLTDTIDLYDYLISI
ncbi:MAG: tetratricopeptide repeat protein [Bacteroidales bacterium]|nr:tetratricopeptide repeat protein [Bacteroidales bacterium]